MAIRKTFLPQLFIFASAVYTLLFIYIIGNTTPLCSLPLHRKADNFIMPFFQLSFDSTDCMLSADLKEGQQVKTKGFYSVGDGGGATYFITSHLGQSGNLPVFHLNNGMFAVLQVNNNTINVDSLGARGDGVSDDAPYIQLALDSGYKVAFGQNKLYRLVSNGLMVNTESIEINGNGSTIVVDDAYAPSNWELKKYIFRGSYSQHNKMKVSDLTFAINMSQTKYGSGSNYLCIIHPIFFDDITLKNVNCNVAPSHNNITNFWMFYGCKNLLLEDCTFANYTTRKEGGILFFQSRIDTVFGRYNNFQNITVNRCNFWGSNGDEILAVWGPNSVKASFNNCDFRWDRANTENTSRMITVSSKEDAACAYNVSFNKCKFSCKSAGNNTTCDSFIGVGTVNPATKINIKFASCDIYANVINSLLHYQYYRLMASRIAFFNYDTDKYNITFDKCNIDCNKTLTGSSFKYDPTSGTTWALDSTFNGCNIKCRYCAVYLQYDDSLATYYAPKITLSHNTISISNSLGIVYKGNEGANGQLNISQNTLTTDGISNVYNTAPQGNDFPVRKQTNAP